MFGPGNIVRKEVEEWKSMNETENQREWETITLEELTEMKGKDDKEEKDNRRRIEKETKKSSQENNQKMFEKWDRERYERRDTRNDKDMKRNRNEREERKIKETREKENRDTVKEVKKSNWDVKPEEEPKKDNKVRERKWKNERDDKKKNEQLEKKKQRLDTTDKANYINRYLKRKENEKEDMNENKRRREEKENKEKFVEIKGVKFGNLKKVEFDPKIDPPPYACFNSWEPGHIAIQCRKFKRYSYCLNCGRRGRTTKTCERCCEAREEYFEKERKRMNGEMKGKESVGLKEEGKKSVFDRLEKRNIEELERKERNKSQVDEEIKRKDVNKDKEYKDDKNYKDKEIKNKDKKMDKYLRTIKNLEGVKKEIREAILIKIRKMENESENEEYLKAMEGFKDFSMETREMLLKVLFDL